MMAAAHVPVMLGEAVAMLAPRDGCLYVDATFGDGGYARAILEIAPCQVVALDRDPEAERRNGALLRHFSARLRLIVRRFGELDEALAEAGVALVDGVAFDLGVSSPQLDQPDRGFSFRADGPLDMRMAGTAEGRETAADLVNSLSEKALARLIRDLGEERGARHVAAAICRERAKSPITRTALLADVVRRVVPKAVDGLDPATRTFQALRIAVNDELGELDRGLAAAERVLRPGGRLCVVSYHSLEDRRVKAFLRDRSGTGPRPSRHQPEAMIAAPSFTLLTRRALRPTAAEVTTNPRARSARLRAAERTAAPAWPGPDRSPRQARRAA